VTLKSGLGVTQSLKMVPFESYDKVGYSHSIVTMTVSCIILKYNEILVENRDCSYPIAFDAAVWEVPVGILQLRLVWKN